MSKNKEPDNPAVGFATGGYQAEYTRNGKRLGIPPLVTRKVIALRKDGSLTYENQFQGCDGYYSEGEPRPVDPSELRSLGVKEINFTKHKIYMSDDATPHIR